MKIFKDIVTDKEVFSDAFKYELIDNSYYIVTGKVVSHSTHIDECKIGGNKSEEAGGDEDVEIDQVICPDLIEALDEAAPITTKEQFKKHLKAYCKKVKDHLKEHHPDKVDEFVAQSPIYAKFVLSNFKKYQWFATDGDGYEVDGIFVALEVINSNPDKGDQVGDVCKMYCLSGGLEEEKC